MWITLVAVLLGAGPAQNSAEALFQRMEQQVLKCKTLQFEFQTVVAMQDITFISAKGRMLIAEGNKLRFEFEDYEGTDSQKGDYKKKLFLSDGMKLRRIPALDASEDRQTNKQLGEKSLASFSRASYLFLLNEEFSPRSGGFDLDKDYGISDMKLGKKEIISGKQAQVIEYRLTPWGKEALPFVLTVTVWIDIQTNLPIKRVLIVKEKKMDKESKTAYFEYYSHILVDKKLDDEVFRLPR